MSDGRGVALRLEACAKTFPNGTRALEAVTLHVDRGETVVFLGPSGCGKTTLLRIIAGLERADPGGRVLFNANDVTDVPIERRNVGMVFQSYALFPNMSVAENIGYGLKIRGMSGKERGARITDLMELTGIRGLEQRRIDQLSGGQRQRVALARAVAVHPSVLLLDEFEPKSRFVAEFVGAANILQATVEDGYAVLPGGRMRMPDGTAAGPATAMLRPEAIAIIDSEGADLCGTVETVSFIGDRQRLTITGAADRPIVVEAPNSLAVEAGQRVGLGIEPRTVRLLPEDRR